MNGNPRIRQFLQATASTVVLLAAWRNCLMRGLPFMIA